MKKNYGNFLEKFQNTLLESFGGAKSWILIPVLNKIFLSFYSLNYENRKTFEK